MLQQWNSPLRLLIAGGLLTSLVLLTTPTAATQPIPTATTEVVATNLNNPRGLAFGSDDALYVAEAGSGGDGPCIQGGEGEVCYGPSGAVTRIFEGAQARVLTGLGSLAGEDGNSATGPHDIALLQNGDAYVVTGLGADPAERDKLEDLSDEFGQLVRYRGPRSKHVADLAAFEQAEDPDSAGADTNPYAVLALRDWRVAVDAGGNTLLQIDRDGNVSTLATFPSRPVEVAPGQEIPMQSVPNSVAIGPDGAYYVGELTGFPFPVDGARVYRVVPGQAPVIYAEGFTNIIDLAFDSNGSLYVLELAAQGLGQAQQPGGDVTGALIRLSPDDPDDRTTLASTELTFPTSVALSPDGGVYVSNFGTFAGLGQVIRVDTCDPSDQACAEPRALPAPLSATLSGAAEVDSEGNPDQGDPDGSGTAIVTLDAVAGEVCLQSSVSGIEQPQAAHIHAGAAGNNGPVVINFNSGIVGNTISACVGADQSLIEEIAANPADYYVNVHNTSFPAGAVRGQLMLASEGVVEMFLSLITR